MESLPDKADIGGEYQLLLVGNKLVLQINDATLTGAQSTKLLSDLGNDKIYKTIGSDDKLTDLLTTNEKLDNKVLYLVLIDNAEMDSTK